MQSNGNGSGPYRRRRVYWEAGDWVVKINKWDAEVSGPFQKESAGYGYEVPGRVELLVFKDEGEAMEVAQEWVARFVEEDEEDE